MHSHNTPLSGGGNNGGNSRTHAHRARDVRRTRQRSAGPESASPSALFGGRQRPPSPSLNCTSPPSSPPYEDHDNNNPISPTRRPRTPVSRPPLKQQQQQQQPITTSSALVNGLVPTSLSWDEPPELTLNSSSNSSNSRLNLSSDRSVSSEWAPSPQSPTPSRAPQAANKQYSPTQDSSNFSVVSDSCLLSPEVVAQRNHYGMHNRKNHKNNNNTGSSPTSPKFSKIPPNHIPSVIDNNGGGADNNNSNDAYDDIPMDERSADIRSHHGGGISARGTAPPNSVNFARPFSNGYGDKNNSNSSTLAMMQPHNPSNPVVASTSPEDDVSSLGGVEENNLGAMIAGLRAKTPTLNGLSPEERILWDTIQSLLLERQQDVTHLQEKMAERQGEHDRAMRAIQRVLADVTHQRDKALAELETAHDHADEKKEEMVMEKHNEEVQSLRDELDKTRKELLEAQKRNTEVQEANATAEAELDVQRKQVSKLKRHLTAQKKVDPADGPEKLKRQLEEKSSALENAKMIITSLENASGDLASDTRVKLKAKDMEISALKMDLHQCKKKLDTLATELREVQRASAECDEYKMQQFQARSELTKVLESSLAELRSASVILETTHDPSSVQNLPELFEECCEALKRSLDHFNESDDEDEDNNYLLQQRQIVLRQEAPSEAETQSLQEELRRMKEEALHYRLEAERVEKQRENEVKNLYAEIQMLRMECSTNMEVLTKKERELVVLRDSLKVEDDEVGYISDDAEDDEDEEESDGNESSPHPATSSSSNYTTSQAEALVTLLAHTGKQQRSTPTANNYADKGGKSGDNDEALKLELTQARLEKERAMKELKTEKESLANAKMIISSLEKANKSMMEDLRSRLHDSNTAIASLLEKSMESEKTTAKLQAELEMEKARNEERMRLMQQQNKAVRTNNNVTAETID